MLRSPSVPSLLSASLIGRLPTGMAPLAILLTVRDNGGDYGVAGLLAALYAASAAVFGPVSGRLVDRTRQATVLLTTALVSSAAFVVLASVDPHAFVFSAGAALVAGAATPPLEPCLRVLWGEVVSGEQNLRAAFSLDAATQELIFVCGPLIVLGATALTGPAAGLLVAGAVGLFGTVWFATAPPARAWRGTDAERHWLGPLRGAGVPRLFAALVCVGATIGVFTVSITGYAEQHTGRGSAGWLIASNAAGALLCGIAYTTAPIARREDRRLLALLVLLALGYLPLAATPDTGPMTLLAFLSGCALPATLASAFALIARMAPEGTLTEAHAWMITSFGVGNAIGSALAGTLLELTTVRTAFVLAAVFGCAAAALAARRLLTDDAFAVIGLRNT
ncbi:MFS transporter [Nocardia transvalensis]|uniref:MFS transporter n=1 Tax=Nocardia transvalensis TaxID=37333 RepID=UPI0018957E78|nr:MFS transporter [Nocardia transvalensis]MBF6331127.1 MFS transporter [Nocardia transvalensis]